MRLFSFLSLLPTALSLSLTVTSGPDFVLDESFDYNPNPPKLSRMSKKESGCGFSHGNVESMHLTCWIEYQEHQLAYQYFKKGDNVLELGARYGTTSCALSKAVGKQGRVVAVDPDVTIYRALLANLEQNFCSYNTRIFPGTIGRVPRESDVAMPSGEYGRTTHTLFDNGQKHCKSMKESVLLPMKNYDPELSMLMNLHCSIGELEKRVGFKFTGLLADCEGCMRQIIDDHIVGLDNSTEPKSKQWDFVIATHKLVNLHGKGTGSEVDLEGELRQRAWDISQKWQNSAVWNRTTTDESMGLLSKTIKKYGKKDKLSSQEVGHLSKLFMTAHHHRKDTRPHGDVELAIGLHKGRVGYDSVLSGLQSKSALKLRKSIADEAREIMGRMKKRHAIIQKAKSKGILQSLNTVIIESDGFVDYALVISDLTELGLTLNETLAGDPQHTGGIKHIAMVRK